MIDHDEPIPSMDRDTAEPPILRIGRHAIGLWKAAEEHGDERLLAVLRPFVQAVGCALARDLMSAEGDGDTTH